MSLNIEFSTLLTSGLSKCYHPNLEDKFLNATFKGEKKKANYPGAFNPVKVDGINSVKFQQSWNFPVSSLLYIAHQSCINTYVNCVLLPSLLGAAEASLCSLAFVEDASRVCSLPCPGNVAQVLIWKSVKLHSWKKVGDFGMPVAYFSACLKR